MKISADTVRHVAKLARLAVSEEEAARLAPQLSDIIGYADELQAVDLADVPPTSHPFALVNVLREDEPRPSLPRERALANAPDTDGEQVRVPAVLEG
ncbi:Asp-tRNA(Asn)/Glu-tRNA(Gln) amidotransferase subunit GatC [Alicyclobacillus macrosporangiidus]|uniref:Aspartyl/glutamyl-tRNA(Asn/Gln) amidotransferase subunit C n=1 Tax=Alicyclobacillus macrosporangiidus TaxID=392015 RepID=A0A1I7JQ02_9BACL|nr:Asp-tRNA(Asn)/Glu-tRNA(Gln) amidotransferase subunit GatC [Alicyclobacillus macrosporangiidus]SFU87208.1 aspartyl-tRNA(Asn)/glutamyl-tRNA(Gln) amidotransferase subunit C [Alicyclobacillus macrosporangiidus]